ncbi:NitT/TauT family transport system ATP-binding protein [Rhizobiales bacterium GAS188]|nr:NitT/TauT family transport system ATP-binding protein [Rhizobiales bacterium GAS188]
MTLTDATVPAGQAAGGAMTGTHSANLRLTIDKVSHSYGETFALDTIDLAFEPGEVVALVGPSGCGKSTLLNILGGLLQPTRGRVLIEGKVPEGCLNPLTYVFQDFALLPWRSVAGNISLVLEDAMREASARETRVAEVLRLTGLADFAGAYPKQLSGGMRQRVGIARALAVRPACLFMDEPLSALDAQTRTLLLDEFASLIARAGTTTVYVTHNLNEAVRLAHRVVVLSRRPGRVKEVVAIERPIETRREGDADLIEVEKRLWTMIRDEASAADKELDNAS